MKRLFLFVIVIVILSLSSLRVNADDLQLETPSAVLMEASTGQVIYEKNPDERRSPASITKIMTLILIMEALHNGNIHLDEDVVTSNHAKSMGGSQVFLEEGEVQTVETLIKCITIASGNDASVAMAEHIAGSEEAFVEKMNEKAAEFQMQNTHFEDCCGLTNSLNHYTTARDVATMSRILILHYPEIYRYTQIWMEDITHTTSRGSSIFTLSSTNKLLKQYPYTTGLKTGSTSVAKYCISATANKDGIDMIAVIMGASDPKVRFSEAARLLQHGFAVAKLYRDDHEESLPETKICKGTDTSLKVTYKGPFTYLDLGSMDFSKINHKIVMKENLTAPVKEGDTVGMVVYSFGDTALGSIDIIAAESMEKAGYGDYFNRILKNYLL